MANLRLSTIPFYTDIQKREILNKYIDSENQFKGIVDLLEMMGNYTPTDNKTFFSYTLDNVFKSATVKSGGGSSINTESTAPIILKAGEGALTKAGDFIVTPAGVVAFVQSVSGDTMTVYNPNSASITIAAGAVVTFPTSGVAEGANTSEMAVPQLIKRSNQLQYFETYTESTDVALGSKVELDFGSQNHYFQLQSHIAFLRHRAIIGNAFLMGKSLTAKDGSNNDVPMTRGLNAYVDDFGVIHDAASSTSTIFMDKADWRAFSRKLDAAKSPDEGHFWCGGDMSASIDDVFDNLLASGSIKYDAFGKGNSKQKAVDMGVQSFTIYDRTYHKSKLAAFENAGTTSAAGSIYPDVGYFVPSGEINTVDGTSVPRIQGRYLNMPGALSGRFQEIETGGLAETPTDRTAVLGYTHRSLEGLEINSPSHFGKIKLSA